MAANLSKNWLVKVLSNVQQISDPLSQTYSLDFKFSNSEQLIVVAHLLSENLY